MSNTYKNYNPDILETIANLSNDEVFTPPKLANEILDLLPEEVWSNPNLTFLDPAVKTGIFLREIASRLIDGLADQIPDLQERVNHILTKQVFGIGITELTTLMSRRTLYCSVTANGEFSICTEFDDEKGNIIFPDTEHTWNKNGRCEYCGVNEENYNGEANRENYAYPFIHDNFEKEFGNMKFDVIIGNPPYQLEDGGESTRSSAIYDLFINKALELNPKYITMIIPSRWMTNNAAGISERWTKKILNDNRIKIMNDYESSVGLFNGVSVSGGVNYFLWDKTYNGPCEYSFNYKNDEIICKKINLNSFDSNILIRDLKLHSIIEKVIAKEGNYHLSDKNNFSYYVSPVSFFGKGKQFLTNWKGYKDHKSNEFNIKYYLGSKGHKSNYGWVKESQVLNGKNKINKNKVFIKAATDLSKLDGNIFYGEPNSVCSQTYLVIGHNKDKDLTKEECFNIISYISTKFFRLLLETKKTTQHGSRKVYQFVPLQDWSKPWTDEELYKKYKLTQEEIDYIEDNIDPMR